MPSKPFGRRLSYVFTMWPPDSRVAVDDEAQQAVRMGHRIVGRNATARSRAYGVEFTDAASSLALLAWRCRDRSPPRRLAEPPAIWWLAD
jgi:hypothetical protein